MAKYYRVKKDNFLWRENAILQDQGKGQYIAVEDIWDMTPAVQKEYISARIVEHENNAEFFERVYPDTVGGKLYHTKDILLAKYKEAFKSN